MEKLFENGTVYTKKGRIPALLDFYCGIKKLHRAFLITEAAA